MPGRPRPKGSRLKGSIRLVLRKEGYHCPQCSWKFNTPEHVWTHLAAQHFGFREGGEQRVEELDLVNKLNFLERHSRAFHSDLQLMVQRTAGDEPGRRLLEVHSTVERINTLFLLATEQLTNCFKGQA